MYFTFSFNSCRNIVVFSEKLSINLDEYAMNPKIFFNSLTSLGGDAFRKKFKLFGSGCIPLLDKMTTKKEIFSCKNKLFPVQFQI